MADTVLIGSFGSFDLRREYCLHNYSYQSSLSTEPQDNSGGKPSTLINGCDLDTVQMDLTLARAMGVVPDNVITALTNLVASRSVNRLTINGTVIGRHSWIIKSVQQNDTVMGTDGRTISCSVSLMFEEYVRQGVAETELREDASSINMINPNTISGRTITSSGVTSGATTAEKSALKREIPSTGEFVRTTVSAQALKDRLADLNAAKNASKTSHVITNPVATLVSSWTYNLKTHFGKLLGGS